MVVGAEVPLTEALESLYINLSDADPDSPESNQGSDVGSSSSEDLGTESSSGPVRLNSSADTLGPDWSYVVEDQEEADDNYSFWLSEAEGALEAADSDSNTAKINAQEGWSSLENILNNPLIDKESSNRAIELAQRLSTLSEEIDTRNSTLKVLNSQLRSADTSYEERANLSSAIQNTTDRGINMPKEESDRTLALLNDIKKSK